MLSRIMPHPKTGIKRITLRNLELATVVALEGLEIRRVESGGERATTTQFHH